MRSKGLILKIVQLIFIIIYGKNSWKKFEEYVHQKLVPDQCELSLTG